jgi:ZIP family zinc transporter
LAQFFERRFHRGFVKTEIKRTSIAFGGGILVAAVAFVLVPEGMRVLSVIPMTGFFSAGATSFYFIYRYLGKRGDSNLGLLLALFFAIQNFPESFNAFLEMRKGGSIAKHYLTNFSLLSVVGIGASVLGYYLLTDRPFPTASLMLFSSGGIIYLIFQYIAPMSKLKRAGLPALGASLGFLVGIIGVKLLH